MEKDETLLLAVLAHIPEAVFLEGFPEAPDMRYHAPHPNLAAGSLDLADQRFGQTRAPCSDQAIESQDLASLKHKTQRGVATVRGQPCHLQHRLARIGFGRQLGNHRGPPDHVGDELVSIAGCHSDVRGGVPSIAEHSDAVAELEYLFQLVTDENESHVVPAQVAQNPEEVTDF